MRQLLVITFLTSTLLLFTSCKENSIQGNKEVLFISNQGNNISLDGAWHTGCVVDNGNILSEIFTFTENNLLIDIRLYNDPSCVSFIGEMSIEIEFIVDGTITVDFNNESVLANKISGIQRINNQEESFKQSIYAVESSGQFQLYHARFPEDGGAISGDGYPTQLVAIPFFRE